MSTAQLTQQNHVHETHMRRALQEALRGARGANPLVGAVLVSADGEILAVGHHRGTGSLHAERDALNQLEARQDLDLSSATLYSTLEPCRHQGRQPACTEAILDAGVGLLVYGAADTTDAAGGGGRRLAEAGVEVTDGVLAEECERLNHRWSLAQERGRPFVTVHLAQSLDAKIAASDGTSQWITSATSRAHSHRVRQRVDAILVGINTVLVDDPRLTARDGQGNLTVHQPLRSVLGLREVPAEAALRRGSPEGQGWTHLRTRDPLEALRTLAATTHQGHPVRHVLVEGGQSVLSAFVAADLVDEIFAYQAPIILGTGRSSIADIGVTTLQHAPRYELDPADGGPVQLMEADVCTHLQPSSASAPQKETSH